MLGGSCKGRLGSGGFAQGHQQSIALLAIRGRCFVGLLRSFSVHMSTSGEVNLPFGDGCPGQRGCFVENLELPAEHQQGTVLRGPTSPPASQDSNAGGPLTHSIFVLGPSSQHQ